MLALIIGSLYGLFLWAIGVLTFIFWLLMLIDCIRSTSLSSDQRIVWVLVIIFLYALGALIYLLAGRKP